MGTEETNSYNIIFNASILLSGVSEEELFNLGAESVSYTGDGISKRVVVTSSKPQKLLDKYKDYIESSEELFPESWANTWLVDFKGIELSQDIYIRSSESKEELDKDYKYVITLNPRDAFGDGHHPTTLMCTELLSSLIATFGKLERGELRMLDIGTGTGILAIIGSFLGIEHIDLCDIDPLSVDRATENCRLNGITSIVPFVADINTCTFDVTYDIITANLLTDILLQSLGKILSILNKNGYCILSGVGDSWTEEFLIFLESQPVNICAHLQKKGWNGFLLKK